MFNSVFNILGLDPFDFGESNVSNGFCQLSNTIKQAMDDLNDSAKYRSPNVRAECTDTLDTFYVELPGVKKEDIDITVTGDCYLTVVAKRVVGKTESTFRSFLHSTKDINNAHVGYADGLLTVTIEPRKKVEPEVKKLQIQ